MSKIEWTDITINPIKAVRKDTGKIGWHCVKVSPECTHCYAEAMNKRNMPGCGTGLPYTVGATDLVTMYFDMKPFEKLARMKAPKKVFPCSMTDLFADFVPGFFITEMFDWFRRLPQHTFQVLTKRAERMAELAPRDPLPNVWLGVTAGDQQRAEERTGWLRRTPAAKRFVSYEPALGPVRFDLAEIHWVIAGGESGRHARPAHPEWFRAVRDQCAAAGVPFFFKQRGEWCWDQVEPGIEGESEATQYIRLDGERGAGWVLESDPEVISNYAGVEPDEASVWIRRIGKKRAGRLLDGREWNQFPEVKL